MLLSWNFWKNHEWQKWSLDSSRCLQMLWNLIFWKLWAFLDYLTSWCEHILCVPNKKNRSEIIFFFTFPKLVQDSRNKKYVMIWCWKQRNSFLFNKILGLNVHQYRRKKKRLSLKEKEAWKSSFFVIKMAGNCKREGKKVRYYKRWLLD